MAIHIHKHDLPAGIIFSDAVAIDTETMGLNPQRDRLCVVQLSAGDGDAHLVQIASPAQPCPRAHFYDSHGMAQHCKKLFRFPHLGAPRCDANFTRALEALRCVILRVL